MMKGKRSSWTKFLLISWSAIWNELYQRSPWISSRAIDMPGRIHAH
jgi:hypothetical protein